VNARGWVVGALVGFVGAVLSVGQSQAATPPNILVPQAGAGAKYGSRDPYTCSSKTAPTKGAITADMATQYFICGHEQVNPAGLLFLAENVHLQVGKPVGKAKSVMLYMMKDADPDGLVYPIRGSFDAYLCNPVDDSFPPDAHGHNCSVQHETNATGSCYRTGFGDWSCAMDGSAPGVNQVPPPGYKPPAAPQAAAAPPAVAAPVGPNPAATNWSSATKGLPPVAQASAPPVAPARALSGTAAEIQSGVQMFERGDYHGAYQKFHTAMQANADDPLAALWEGITLDALGRSDGFDFVHGNDPQFGVAADELLALSSWRHREIDAAKTVLTTCSQSHPENTSCADMMHGVESGASPPPVKDWPAIVGLTKATAARGTVWMPTQQP